MTILRDAWGRVNAFDFMLNRVIADQRDPIEPDEQMDWAMELFHPPRFPQMAHFRYDRGARLRTTLPSGLEVSVKYNTFTEYLRIVFQSPDEANPDEAVATWNGIGWKYSGSLNVTYPDIVDAIAVMIVLSTLGTFPLWESRSDVFRRQEVLSAALKSVNDLSSWACPTCSANVPVNGEWRTTVR